MKLRKSSISGLRPHVISNECFCKELRGTNNFGTAVKKKKYKYFDLNLNEILIILVLFNHFKQFKFANKPN